MCKQLSYEERVRIAELCQAEYSRSEMARALKRSPATIGRELARNGVQAAYSAEVAQGLAERRKSERPIVRKMDRQEIRDAAENGLIQCWSPDQIAARQELLFPKEPKQQVSGSTILRWIQRQPGPLRRHWSKFLRRRGRAPFRPRKPPVEPAKRIRNRPAIIERRGRVGDFEGDLVLGAPGTGGVLTVVCRRSRYLKVVKVQNKLSKHVLKKFRRSSRNSPSTAAAPAPSTTAASSPRSTEWKTHTVSIYISPSRVVRTSVARTKTPTAFYDNSSPKGPTSAPSPMPNCAAPKTS